jgi:FkbM family methyltransferase
MELVFLLLLLFFTVFIVASTGFSSLENYDPDDAFKRIRKVSHPSYGEIYIFDDQDAISSSIMKFGQPTWEEALCKVMAENYIPGTDMMDIGANLGLNTIYSNKLNPITGTVHLFEPQSDVFTMLKFNTRNLQSRKLYNITLGGSEPEILSFSQQPDNVGGTNIRTGTEGSVNVAAIPLDLINFPNPISFIKMDVEGAEYKVLIGAKNTLAKHSPTLLIEVSPNTEEDLRKLLDSYGYSQIAHIGGIDYLFRKTSLKK